MNAPDLPPPVRSYLFRAEQLQLSQVAVAIRQRIATAPEMRNVWKTLKDHGASDADLLDFVRCACREPLPPIMTRKARDAFVKQYADMARRCHEATPSSRRIAPRLAAAAPVMAKYFKAKAKMMSTLDSPWVVENHIEDDEDRAYVQALGQKTKYLFGKTLYGTLATVASVVLDRPINWSQVRKWCTDRENPLTPATLRAKK